MHQTQASDEVLRGKDFWRLRQQLESAGDIFEIDESVIALYVGPDSDAADLKVTYFDPAQPNGLQSAVISPGTPFNGRLDALLDQAIPATGQKARILVQPADIIGVTYLRPVLPQPAVIVRIPTFIDLIGVFGELIQVPTQRSDRQFRTPVLTVGAGGTGFPNSTDIVFPLYNRRCWSVEVSRSPSAVSMDVDISAVRLTPGANNQPVSLGSMSFAGISVEQTQSLSFRACETGLDSADVQRPGGLWDLLLVNLQTTAGGGPTPASVAITASDREG